MMLPVKAAFGHVKRRFSIDTTQTYDQLSAQIASVFGLTPPFSLTYQDNEGDYIAVSTQQELDELFRLAEHESMALLRLSINSDPNSDAPTPAQQPQQPQPQQQEQPHPQSQSQQQPQQSDNPPRSALSPHIEESLRRAEATAINAAFDAENNVQRVFQCVRNALRNFGPDGQRLPRPPQSQSMPAWAPSPPPFRYPPPPPRRQRERFHRRRARDGPFGMFTGMGGMGGAGGAGGAAGMDGMPGMPGMPGMSGFSLAPFLATLYPMMAACASESRSNISQPTRDAFEQLKNAVMNSDNTDVAFQAARNAFPALRNWLIANLGQNGPINSEAIGSLLTTVERTIRPSVGEDITTRATHLLRTALNDQAVLQILRNIPWNMDLPFDVDAEFNSGGVSAPQNEMPFQTHVNVECDNCQTSPIVGTRYQATNRPNYDLCSNCYNDSSVSKEGINFKKLTYIWEASLGDVSAPPAPLSLRSRGPRVAFLQKILTDLGYMNESMYLRVVGMYGPRTRAAVSQFQREYSLTGTAQLGVYDDITAASLISMLEAQVPPTAAAGGAATTASEGTGPTTPASAPGPSPAQG
eukprot:gb/GEZJ01000235.1/.p1 GENE.gb/GEZJ01000235.1/~~gb/GEZJ01000235.1/.p1  ORF type:complete len:581 (-),score=96.91 gb/GEZJ01000235.1/:1832-3574(-)